MKNFIGYIYVLKNLVNNKVYIGQTVQKLHKRFKQHICSGNRVLKNSIKKYGEDNFIIYSTQVCYSKQELDDAEKFFISQYDSLYPKGFNLVNGCDLKNVADFLKKERRVNMSRGSVRKKTKSIVNIKTGEKWASLKELSHHCGLSLAQSRTLKCKLNGNLGNNTDFRYVGDENKPVFYGKKMGRASKAKKVINVKTGEIFSCAKEVALLLNVCVNTFRERLRGFRKNNTDFRYYKEDSYAK